MHKFLEPFQDFEPINSKNDKLIKSTVEEIIPGIPEQLVYLKLSLLENARWRYNRMLK